MDTEVRILEKPEEFAQANINGCIAFNGRLDPSEDINTPMPYSDTYGVFEDGRLVSHLIAFHYQMTCHGKYVPMCGVGGVCSLIESRNKGYIRRLFHALFNDLRAKGCMYSYLYPFSGRYYNQFGYGPGVSRVKAIIPIERLEGHTCGYDIKMYRPGDSFEPYQAVFEKFAARYSGMTARNDWKRLEDYTPEKNGKSMFLFTENGEPKAYLGYKHKKDGNSLTAHQDVAWADTDAFRNILGFVYKLKMHYEKFIITLPQSFPIESMLTEQWGLTLERYMAGQLRIIDAAGAMKIYPWPNEKGEIVIGVEDGYFSDQCGSFRVSFGAGEAAVEKCNTAPDITLDIKALSPLLMGVYGYDDLAYLPPDWVTVNKNRALLEKAFARRPVFLTEQF